MATEAKRWSERLGVGIIAARKLIALSDIAATAQTNWHNGDATAEAADKAVKRVEDEAKEYGFSVIWPGLYPVFVKDETHYTLPG